MIFYLSFIFGLVFNLNTYASIEVQGHRGTRALRPENTLPAFKKAIEVGVDVLELDLQVTKDDVLIISHDPFIASDICVVKEPILIRSISAAQVQAYDCGSVVNPRFPKQKLIAKTPKPTLEALFQMVKASSSQTAKKVKFNIETKINPYDVEMSTTPERFVKLILDLVKKYNLLSRVYLQSFDNRTLLIAKKLEPKLITVQLTSDNHLDYVAIAKSSHADIISPDFQWILKEDVTALHKAKIKVIPWTVNQEKDWKKLIDMNVDGIISDDPEALIEFLRTSGLK